MTLLWLYETAFGDRLRLPVRFAPALRAGKRTREMRAWEKRRCAEAVRRFKAGRPPLHQRPLRVTV